MTFRPNAMQRGILPVSIALALAPAFAVAQDAPPAEEATTLDRIEVTGSRIRQAEVENQQPIIVVNRQQIEQQGFTSVADILQNLTSAGSPAIARSEALASGENVGGYYVDIRNLGAQRTLVLVNGKRLGATTSGLQDLSQIPVAAIERIEVLKDGGSTLYGSDAIAGVVHIITRRNFDGVEASAYLGQYDEGDGFKQSYGLTIGNTGDRSSLTMSFEYADEEPVNARDRDFSAYGNVGLSNAEDFPFSGWSAITHRGSALLPCGPGGATVYCTLTPGTDPTNIANYVPMNPSLNAHPNEQMYLQTGIERHAVLVSGTIDLTDDIRFRSDFQYNKRSTQQQIAGYPYQSLAFGTPMSGDSFFTPTPGTDLTFRRRLWEMPRRTQSNLDTFRIAAGFEGTFQIGERYFDWDAGVNLNRNDSTKIARGDASLAATAAALGASWFNPVSGRVECGTAAAPIAYGTNIGNGECVPWNPLAPAGDPQAGSLTDNPDLIAFLFPQYTDTGRTESKTYSANLSGSLFTLPAGDLGFAVGVEHRAEDGRFVPDAFAQAGLSTGLPATTTEGKYSLNEIYGELAIPVLADLAFAKELSFNVATRYSDYSNFGSTNNSKFAVRYRPIDGLLFRGTWAEGFRAPSINDLFGGLGGSFEFYTDPCGVQPGNPNVNGNAACNAAGVPIGYVQLGQGLVPCTTWPCQTPDQFLSGSNPNLSPEEAETKTLGAVWSPKWVEGLDIAVDWYNYELTDAIVTDSVNSILRDCYELGISARCAGIVRAPDGHITSMFFGLANLGAIETEGWDVGVNYRLPETSFGNFVINWDNSYTSQFDTITDGVRQGQVGRAGLTAQTVFRLRSNLGVNWSMGNYGVSYMARYYSGLAESCVGVGGCSDPDHISGGAEDPINRLGSNTFHDAQFYVKLPIDATVAIGANNIFDHQGPLMYTQPSSNFPYYGGFDIGRQFYLKYTQKF